MGSAGGLLGRHFAWLLVLGGALSTSACGTSSGAHTSSSAGAPAGADAGSSGAAGSLGGNAGVAGRASGGGGSGAVAGGATGGSPASDGSKTSACLVYTAASCARSDACRGRSDDCTPVGLVCPDSLFSAGSARTAAEVLACAKDYESFPCDKLLAGYLPACVTAGTRKGGETCAFNSQCASLTCMKVGSIFDSSCSTCAAPAALGEDCNDGSIMCLPGLRCSTARKCEVAPPATIFRAQVGDPCPGNGSACNELTSYCPPGGSTCTAFPALGAMCFLVGQCADDGYCDENTSLCTAGPPAGTKCGSDTRGLQHCATDSYCSSGACVRLPAIGAACAVDPSTGKAGLCAKDARCTGSDAAAMCVAKSPSGATCASAGDCQDGLWCGCSAIPCTAAGTTCNDFRLEGQPCGDSSGAVCHPGYACTAGTCQPVDSQGIFAACPAH